MNKRQREAEARRVDSEEREMIELLAADKTKPWKCGVWDTREQRSVEIYASADTEEEARMYMETRYRRNSGVIPHRLGTEVGWWFDAS